MYDDDFEEAALGWAEYHASFLDAPGTAVCVACWMPAPDGPLCPECDAVVQRLAAA